MEVENLTRGKPTHPHPVRPAPSGSPWPAAGRRRRPGRGLAGPGSAWPRAGRALAARWPRRPPSALREGEREREPEFGGGCRSSPGEGEKFWERKEVR